MVSHKATTPSTHVMEDLTTVLLLVAVKVVVQWCMV